MTTCIRCGANVALDSGRNMFVTTAGGFSCPSSLPGEAAVHRIAAHPPTRPKPKRGLMDALFTLGTMIAAYKGAEYVTRGHHNFGGQPQYYGDPSQDQTYGGMNITNGFRQLDERRRFGA